MLKRLLHITWLLCVALLLLAAVVLTSVRLLVPELADYRLDIESAASEALGRQVSIARIEATWRDMGPVLKLKNVAIGSQEDGPQRLEIREIWVSVDVEHYLAEQELRFSGKPLSFTANGWTSLSQIRVSVKPWIAASAA